MAYRIIANPVNFFFNLIVLVASLHTDKARAQSIYAHKFNIGIEAEGGTLTGYEVAYHSGMVGGALNVQYGIVDNLGIVLSGGYENFFGKDFTLTDAREGYISYQVNLGNYAILPIKLGIKWFYTEKLYVAIAAGIAFEESAGISDPVTGERYFDPEYKQTKFLVSPGLGYSLKHFNVGLTFDHFSGQNTYAGDLPNTYEALYLHVAYYLSAFKL